MCGRYALYGPRALSRAERTYFGGLDAFPPNYNAAPSEMLPIARLVAGQVELTAAKWGLVPHWASDEKTGFKAINARGETCATSPLYRGAYRDKRRCLVPANGFYEWKKHPAGKQPYFITSGDGALLAFAGLWESWRRPNGDTLVSYAVITGEPNEVVKPLHNRMPVILPPEAYAQWLTDADPRALLRPCAPEMLIAYPVSSRVNKPQNKDADLVEPSDAVKHIGRDET